MGATLDALNDLSRVLPQAAAFVGLIAFVMYTVQSGLSAIPFVGGIAASAILALGTGAMYAVANHATTQRRVSTAPIVELVRTRWLSLLGVFVVLLALGLGLTIAGGVVAMVFVVVTASVGLGELGAVFVVLAVLGAYLLFGLIGQFLYPAVAIDDVGAIDALTTAGGIVRDRPVSALGFTLLRVTVEYVPFFLGLSGAAVLLSDALAATAAAFEEALPDPDAPAAAPDPADLPDPAELFLAEVSILTVSAAVGLILLGLLVGDILRIYLTTAYYRRVGPDARPDTQPVATS